MDIQLGIQSSYEEKNKIAVVTITGELDLYSLDEFKTVLGTAEKSECTVILLDLRELEFIDSSGLGAIIGLQGRASKQNKKIVICPSEVVAQTLKLTGLHRVIRSVSSPEDIRPV